MPAKCSTIPLARHDCLTSLIIQSTFLSNSSAAHHLVTSDNQRQLRNCDSLPIFAISTMNRSSDFFLQIMKIGISCHHIYGGSRAMATELGKALAMKGYTVHFFSQATLFRLGIYSRNIHCHEIEAHVAV